MKITTSSFHKILKSILLSLFILCNVSILNSQTITWQNVYGGKLSEYGRDGIQTFEGGYIIVAKRQDQNGGTLLLKLDPFGNEEWSRIVDNTSIGVSIQQTNDSGFVIAGSDNSIATLIKTDKLGFLLWRKTYSISNQSSRFSKVKLLNNGDLILCGAISLPNKAYFVKTDSGGNIVWQKTFSSSSSFTLAYDITYSNDGYFYATGVTSINNFPKTLYGKIDVDGNFIWFKNYGSEGKGDAQSGSGIICQNNNISFICGQKDIFYAHRGHFSKIDSSGNMLFQKEYNSASDFVSIAKNHNNYALCGSNYGLNNINLVVANDEGIEQSNKFYSFNTFDELTYAYSLSSTLDNGYFIIGSTSYLGSDFELNIVAIKTDSLGNTIVSIKNSNSVFQKDFILYQNYPNPFNPNTKIKFTIPSSEFTSLKVYNISGKEISNLINSKIQAGSYEVVFDGSDLPSGVYYYKIKSENFQQVRKMVLLK